MNQSIVGQEGFSAHGREQGSIHHGQYPIHHRWNVLRIGKQENHLYAMHLRHSLQHLHQEFTRRSIQSDEGIIKNQQTGMFEQCPYDQEFAQLSAGEIDNLLGQQLPNGEQVDQ